MTSGDSTNGYSCITKTWILTWRARMRGWKFLYTPASVVYHVHCGSSEEWSPFFLYHVERNRVLVNLKNAPTRLALRVLASFGYRVARKWLKILILRERGKRNREHALSYAKALLSLLWELPGMLTKRIDTRIRRRLVPDTAFAHLIAPNP